MLSIEISVDVTIMSNFAFSACIQIYQLTEVFFKTFGPSIIYICIMHRQNKWQCFQYSLYLSKLLFILKKYNYQRFFILSVIYKSGQSFVLKTANIVMCKMVIQFGLVIWLQTVTLNRSYFNNNICLTSW